MDRKTTTVFMGWSQLTPAQRHELQQAIDEFERQPEWKQKSQLDEFRGAVRYYLGPIGQGCPCCGR